MSTRLRSIRRPRQAALRRCGFASSGRFLPLVLRGRSPGGLSCPSSCCSMTSVVSQVSEMRPGTAHLLQQSGFVFLKFFGWNDDGGGDFVVSVEVEKAYALCCAAGCTDRFRVDADDLAELAD